MNRYFLTALVVLSSLVSFPLAAQETDKKLLSDLEYPELLVTPSATDRLKMEAKKESKGDWTNLLAIQAAGLTTLMAGSALSGDYKVGATQDEIDKVDNATQLANLIGGGWLVTGTMLYFFYKPYENGYREVKAMPHSTKREKLTRERQAEHHITSAGKLGNKLKWMAFATNFLAGAAVAASGQEDSRVMGGIAALTSFAPLLFETHWESTCKEHDQFKKRIYGPVGGVFQKEDGNLVPTIGLLASF